MLDLSLRLLAAGLIFLVAGWLGTPDIGVAGALGAAVAAYAGIGYWMETKRRKGALSEAVLASADAASIAFLLGSLHQLDQLAFLSLLPILNAHRRFGANIWAMAPVSIGALIVAAALFGPTDPSASLYLQVVGMLALTFLAPRSLQSKDVNKPSFAPVFAAGEYDPKAFIALRENFRKIRDLHKELERTSKRDRIAAQILQCKLPSGKRFHSRLADKLAEIVGVQSLALYTLSQFGNTMVARATSGAVAEEIEDVSFTVDLTTAMRRITDNIELSTRSMLTDLERAKLATVLLQHENRIIGMMNIFHSDWDQLYEAKRLCEEFAPLVASVLMDERRAVSAEKRVRELELLYETAIVNAGAADRPELAKRITKQLARIVDADFIGTYLIEGTEAHLVSHNGPEVTFLDSMSFSSGPGLAGWMASGAPELVIFKPADDQRCNTEELLKKRVGGLILIPLQSSETPFGFIAAVSKADGGLDMPDLKVLRSVAAEFSQAIVRLGSAASGSFGLVSGNAFQVLAGSSNPGYLAYFEVLKRNTLFEICTGPAIEEALKAFSFRLYGKLPAGGAACQRRQGDFVAYLPETSEEFAKSWANDVAATASMIGVATSGGNKTVPLAVRARVAVLGAAREEADEPVAS